MRDNTYDLKPSKEAYQAVKSDVTPISAFKELIDNSLDNWRRVLDGLDPVKIEIEYHDNGPDGEDEIVIRDDSGGVEEDDLHILFALGQSNKGEIGGSIGAYGVGAKKAIVNLGNEATIRSRHLYADSGFGFSIDEDWLHDDDDWTVEKVEFDDIEKGVTEIRISDLNTPWNKFSDELEENLSETYQYFLREDRMEDMETVSITIREFDEDGNTEEVIEVEPPEEVDWSFTPMDDLFVRRYEGIDLESKEFDDTVEVNITVGLMQEASAADSGADIFCQNRLVLSGVTDERAGFGRGSGSAKLGKFSGQHRRLRVIIEFVTEGDATVLPWDAQKSDIDPYNRVSRAAFDWIRRIVRPYYVASGAYDEIPTTLTRPYGRDSDYAVTDHLDDPYDYSGRKRVTHKPDTDFTDAAMITQRADTTAALRIYSPGDLPKEFEPAYREEFLRLINDEYDIKLEEDEAIPTEAIPEADVPESLSIEEANDVYDELSEKAAEHARREPSEREVGLPDWKQTLYDTLLREELEHLAGEEENVDLDDLSTFEAEEPAETDESDEAEEAADELSTGDLDTGEADTTDESPDADEFEGLEVDTDTQQDAIGEVADEDPDQMTDEQLDDEGDTGSIVATPDADRSVADEDGETPAATKETANHSLDLDEDQWETLVDALGLDESASPDEVTDRLFDTVDVLRQLPTSS